MSPYSRMWGSSTRAAGFGESGVAGVLGTGSQVLSLAQEPIFGRLVMDFEDADF
jgi:hypothetical protein